MTVPRTRPARLWLPLVTAAAALGVTRGCSCAPDLPSGFIPFPDGGVHVRRDGAVLDLAAPPGDAERGAIRRALPPCEDDPHAAALFPASDLCDGRASLGRARDPAIAAAGDIACQDCGQGRTADVLMRLVEERGLSAILPLGDNAYPSGYLSEFLAHYDLTWGQPPLRRLTRPVPGNHDYGNGVTDGAGYWDYFNGEGVDDGPAGRRGKGFYSYEIGAWHLIALNSECPVHGCAEEQVAWLVDDLRRHPAQCTLAYWHRPRFQRGTFHGSWAPMADVWNALYDARADVVLAGHEHNYQQFAPMNKEGVLDRDRGIRSFVVGTGGMTSFYLGLADVHLDAFEDAVLGRNAVLLLTLGQGEYSWRLVGDAFDVLVEGHDVCR